MNELKGVRLPSWYNGIGGHDTPGSEVATWDYSTSREHALRLLEHGITAYKLFGGTTKVERARAYVDAGLLVAVRFWVERPWGRRNYSWVTPADQVQQFADVGVQLFEPGWNEFNIAGEWVDDNIPPQAWAIADEVIAAWQVGLNGPGQVAGVKLLFPSNTPGGNVDHRWCYNEITAKLRAQGLMGTVEHIACHPRPHNNPPDTIWTDTNTVTFDEWRWIRDKFNNGAYLWATEHGYSLKDDQNHNYPQIDLGMWTDYNWTLFKRMNQAEPQAIEPQLAGAHYWIDGGFGHWGGSHCWGKDALEDSPVPEMPAPSPLWIRMGERVNELEFNRYDVVPPVVLRARGFDCSSYQGDINWQAVTDDFSFVFIRASTGASADTRYAENYDAAHERGLLVGAYHYLTQADSGQAALFYNTVGDRVPELGYYADLEASDLTADKCQLFLEYADNWTMQTTGIYTRASFFDRFGQPLWTMGRPLWVAHWGVDSPTLPQAWSTWEFWQIGQGPVAGQTMDLNEYNGTVDDLLDVYEDEEPPMTEPTIIDITGTQRDWAWLVANYGAVEILPSGGYQVTKIIEVEGLLDFTCTLLNAAGGPVAGQQVAYVTPTQEYIEITDSYGVARHTAGSGEGYWLPGPGVVEWYVVGQEGERITGLGWLRETQYRHLQFTMQLDGEPEPPPPDDFEADTTARLERIEQLLIHVHGHLGPD